MEPAMKVLLMFCFISVSMSLPFDRVYSDNADRENERAALYPFLSAYDSMPVKRTSTSRCRNQNSLFCQSLYMTGHKRAFIDDSESINKPRSGEMEKLINKLLLELELKKLQEEEGRY